MAHVTRSQLKTTREIVAGKLLKALLSKGLVQREYRRVRAAYLLTGYAPRTTVYK
jgi:predicted transcriptional regulator